MGAGPELHRPDLETSTPRLAGDLIPGRGRARWEFGRTIATGALQRPILQQSPRRKTLPISICFTSQTEVWCPGADSNRYTLRHRLLRPACLPIPPPGQRADGHDTRPRHPEQENRFSSSSRSETSASRGLFSRSRTPRTIGLGATRRDWLRLATLQPFRGARPAAVPTSRRPSVRQIRILHHSAFVPL